METSVIFDNAPREPKLCVPTVHSGTDLFIFTSLFLYQHSFMFG